MSFKYSSGTQMIGSISPLLPCAPLLPFAPLLPLWPLWLSLPCLTLCTVQFSRLNISPSVNAPASDLVLFLLTPLTALPLTMPTGTGAVLPARVPSSTDRRTATSPSGDVAVRCVRLRKARSASRPWRVAPALPSLPHPCPHLTAPHDPTGSHAPRL